MRLRVDHLNRIVIADRDQDELSILCQFDAAWSLADLDRLDDRELVDIDHADRVALLVRDIGNDGSCLTAEQDEEAYTEQASAPHPCLPACRLFELAFALGPVISERIQLRNLMQKSLLRRHRNDHPAVGH